MPSKKSPPFSFLFVLMLGYHASSVFPTPAQQHSVLLAPHWDLYPSHYVVQRSPVPFDIDGDIYKDVWQTVPWSAAFGDIQGSDAPADALRPALTQFKALYDDEYLYICALLHPAPGLPTQAHFTERNSPIFQKDSDFEVFVDCSTAAGSNHHYKELEVNAINTVWNLMLDKPYADNGHEHSARVARPGDPDYYEVYRQRTATRVWRGTVNDDAEQGALWSVEMALAVSDLQAFTTASTASSNNHSSLCGGRLWRVNFSRVERQGLINWTWQPQMRWDPANRRFAGFVNMHDPDAWGYLQLSGCECGDGGEDDSSSSIAAGMVRDPLWPAKLTAMTVYYALHYHKEQTGVYTDSLDDLIVPRDIVDPFVVVIELVDDEEEEVAGGFRVTVVMHQDDNDDKTETTVSVHDDRLLTVQSKEKSQQTLE